MRNANSVPELEMSRKQADREHGREHATTTPVIIVTTCGV